MSGFEAPLPVAPAVAVAVGVWLAAAAVEGLRARRGRARRLGLSALALAALLGLYLGPVRSTPRAESAYLLTGGWVEALAAEGASLDAEVPVWTRPGESGQLPRRARSAPLSRLGVVAGRFRAVGDGLEPWEREELGVPVSLEHPADLGQGISAVSWRRRLPRGEPLVVAGRLADLPAGTDVELVGPGGVEDRAESGALGGFRLHGLPRADGRSLWRLEVAAPGSRSIVETLDLEVVAPPPLAVLWLEHSPSFESGPIERWLRESGRSMAVRSRVSRDRYRSELHNLPSLDLSRLTPELLERFDVLVADAGSVAAWTGRERAAVDRAVREGGLGLLLAARREESTAALERLAGLAVEGAGEGGEAGQAGEAETWLVRARLEEVGIAPPLETGARRVRPDPGVRPLVADAAGRILAAARARGAGAVALSLLDQTYRWVLRGETPAHRAFWRALFGGVARPPRTVAEWRIAAGPARVDRPVEVALVADAAAPQARWAGPGEEAAELALRQDPLDPRRWTAVLRPRRPGWHRLESGSAQAWLYAQPREAWATLARAQRQAGTRAAEVVERPAERTPGPPIPVPDARVRLLLLLTAVGALAGLWWQPDETARAAADESG